MSAVYPKFLDLSLLSLTDCAAAALLSKNSKAGILNHRQQRVHSQYVKNHVKDGLKSGFSAHGGFSSVIAICRSDFSLTTWLEQHRVRINSYLHVIASVSEAIHSLYDFVSPPYKDGG